VARTDLLLVSGNPLQSLEALQRPLGVMSAGRWRTQRQLDELLADSLRRAPEMRMQPDLPWNFLLQHPVVA
jgi:hypothetical protein